MLRPLYWNLRALWRRQVVARTCPSLSQFEQDRWVIREMFRGKRNGYFLEIGSTDGFLVNNTFLLEARYGWDGICVEANPKFHARLRIQRKATIVEDCIDRDFGVVEFALRQDIGGIVAEDTDNRSGEGSEVLRLKARPLLDVLEKAGAPKVIDYFSLDAEGAEERILDRFDFSRYVFSTMTVERPSLRLQQILADNRYILVKHIPGVDNFYVHRSFIPELLRLNTDIEDWIRTDYCKALDAFEPSWLTPVP